MDFGEVLSQWEEIQVKNAKLQKKTENKPRPRLPNAPSAEDQISKATAIPKADTEDCPDQQNQQPKANPMDVWLRRYGVVDKDTVAEKHRQQVQNTDKEYLKKLPVGAKIDLHGLTRDEAWTKLDEFITDCCRRRLRKILIVHGKGNHTTGLVGDCVLASMVRTFIERDDRLGMSGHPDKKMGGNGATWVIIKKTN
ncbi:MAG: Smr/MutS family protein [Spirochaetaceae bacterium]|nr:Smr/MutS family protein [Spirochaetaceae bacterium]